MNVVMEGIVNCFNQAQKEPLNHRRISAEVSASQRSKLESSLMRSSEAGLEYAGFYVVLGSPESHVWTKANRMRDLRQSNTPCSQELCFPVVGFQLLLGTGDADWHHQLLVNLDVLHESSIVSEAAMKRKRRSADTPAEE